MERVKLEELLDTGNLQQEKLNKIVLNAIEEEKLLSRKLYEPEEKDPSFGNRVADDLAIFGGSWKFILSFSVFLICWMVINILLGARAFDSFPFILLNLFLSAIAALQAPIIMMSQNRKEEKDRQRAINDYLINLKAEIEVRNLHRKVDLLIAEQMKTLFQLQSAQMELMEEIKANIKSNNGNKMPE